MPCLLPMNSLVGVKGAGLISTAPITGNTCNTDAIKAPVMKVVCWGLATSGCSMLSWFICKPIPEARLAPDAVVLLVGRIPR